MSTINEMHRANCVSLQTVIGYGASGGANEENC